MQVFSTPKRKEKCKQSTKERICIVHNFKHKNYGQLKAITNKRWTKIQDNKIIRFDSQDDNEKQLYICEKIPDGYHDY